MNIKQKIGERIAECRKNLGLNIKQLSEKTGSLAAARISNWENGTRSPGPSEAILLAKALDVAASYLLCLSNDIHGEIVGPEDVLPRMLPIIPINNTHQDKKSLKKLIENTSPFSDSTKVSLEHTSKQQASKNTFATTLIDNSMQPAFLSGDIVIVDPDRQPKPGDFVLAHIVSTNENIIRKYRETDEHTAKNKSYELTALNADWRTVRISSGKEAEIIGAVIEHRKYL